MERVKGCRDLKSMLKKKCPPCLETPPRDFGLRIQVPTAGLHGGTAAVQAWPDASRFEAGPM